MLQQLSPHLGNTYTAEGPVEGKDDSARMKWNEYERNPPTAYTREKEDGGRQKIPWESRWC